MIEKIADPAESLLSPELSTSEDMSNMASDESTRPAIIATLTELCFYMLLFYSAFVTLANRFFLNPKLMLEWGIKDAGIGMDFACKSVSACFATICATLGLVILTNPKSQRLQSQGAPSESEETLDVVVQHFMLFATAYFLYDMYAMFEVYLAKQAAVKGQQNGAGSRGGRQEVDVPKAILTTGGDNSPAAQQGMFEFVAIFCSFVRANPLISAHHLVIALVFAPMMTYMFRSHEPGLLMLGAAFVLESSTPFVTLRSVLADLGLKNSLAYLINGLALIMIFFLCRIAIYPVFFKVYADSRGVTFVEGLARPPLTCYFYVLLTLLPQLYWFRLLVKGAFKTLNKYNTEDDKSDANSNQSTKHD